jgi:hypothetical protein
VDLGSYMVAKGLLSYGVSKEGKPNLPFKDDDYFYSFSPKIQAVGPEERIMIEERKKAPEVVNVGEEKTPDRKLGGAAQEEAIMSLKFSASTNGWVTPTSTPKASAPATPVSTGPPPLPLKNLVSGSPRKSTNGNGGSPTKGSNVRVGSPSRAVASPKKGIHRALLGPTLCRAITTAVRKEEDNARLRRELEDLKLTLNKKSNRDVLGELQRLKKQLAATQAELQTSDRQRKRLESKVAAADVRQNDIFTVVDALQVENARLRSFSKEVEMACADTTNMIGSRRAPGKKS